MKATQMKCYSAFALIFAVALPLSPAEYRPDLGKKLGFTIYTNNPPGKQLSGPHAPATAPALSPRESHTKFMVPTGIEVRLFASETEVGNPAAMTGDVRAW